MIPYLRGALSAETIERLAAVVGVDLIPSASGIRAVMEGEGRAYTQHLKTVVRCIDELNSAENVIHFAQLWMVLYVMSVAASNSAASGDFRAWLNTFNKKNEGTNRYRSVGLRLVAALLFHPEVVTEYLRKGGEPHFNVFAQSHHALWLLGGSKPGVNIVAAVKYSMALRSKGYAVTFLTVEKEVVPFLQRKRTTAQVQLEAEAERQERREAQRWAADEAAEDHTARIQRMRVCSEQMAADMTFANERKEASDAVWRERQAREAAVINRRRQGQAEVGATGEERTATVAAEQPNTAVTEQTSTSPSATEVSHQPVPPQQTISPRPPTSSSPLSPTPPLAPLSAPPSPSPPAPSAVSSSQHSVAPAPQPSTALIHLGSPVSSPVLVDDDDDDEKALSDVDPDEVREVRKSSRIPRRVNRPDAVPEDELEELEQTGFDLSAREEPRRREEKWPVEEILSVEPDEDGQMWYRVKWAGYDEPTIEPAWELNRLDVVHKFWLDYYVKAEEEIIRCQSELVESRDELKKREKEIADLRRELNASRK